MSTRFVSISLSQVVFYANNFAKLVRQWKECLFVLFQTKAKRRKASRYAMAVCQKRLKMPAVSPFGRALNISARACRSCYDFHRNHIIFHW